MIQACWCWIKRNPNLSFGILGWFFTLPIIALVLIDQLTSAGFLPPEPLELHPAVWIFDLGVIGSFLLGCLLMISALFRSIHCRLRPDDYREADKVERASAGLTVESKVNETASLSTIPISRLPRRSSRTFESAGAMPLMASPLI